MMKRLLHPCEVPAEQEDRAKILFISDTRTNVLSMTDQARLTGKNACSVSNEDEWKQFYCVFSPGTERGEAIRRRTAEQNSSL